MMQVYFVKMVQVLHNLVELDHHNIHSTYNASLKFERSKRKIEQSEDGPMATVEINLYLIDDISLTSLLHLLCSQ